MASGKNAERRDGPTVVPRSTEQSGRDCAATNSAALFSATAKWSEENQRLAELEAFLAQFNENAETVIADAICDGGNRSKKVANGEGAEPADRTNTDDLQVFDAMERAIDLQSKQQRALADLRDCRNYHLGRNVLRDDVVANNARKAHAFSEHLTTIASRMESYVNLIDRRAAVVDHMSLDARHHGTFRDTIVQLAQTLERMEPDFARVERLRRLSTAREMERADKSETPVRPNASHEYQMPSSTPAVQEMPEFHNNSDASSVDVENLSDLIGIVSAYLADVQKFLRSSSTYPDASEHIPVDECK